METSSPIHSFMDLYSLTMLDGSFDFGLVIDQIGNTYKGKFSRSRFCQGELLGENNRVMKVTSTHGERYRGIMLLCSEEMSYIGDTDHLKMSGRGTLISKAGKLAFTGYFENDLPHGSGVLYDKNGKQSKDSFSGYFLNGLKKYGKIEDESIEVTGLFSRKLDWRYNPQNNLRVTLPVNECISMNSKAFVITGWMNIKGSQRVTFGQFKDSDLFLNGLYRINYRDGSMYKGHFIDSHREGDFIMSTPSRDFMIGSWRDTRFVGMIMWNQDDQREYSAGLFIVTNENVVVQQGFGKIKLRDGSVYLGEVANSMFNGFGELTRPNSSYYKGFFKDGLCHDVGEELDTQMRLRYKGHFFGNLRHGFGIIEYLDKTLEHTVATIQGYFQQGECVYCYNSNDPSLGQINGHQIVSVASTVKFSEDRMMYVPSGHCSIVLDSFDGQKANADLRFKYEGEITDGRITGAGIITFKEKSDNHDNRVYEGELKDGKLHGFGRLDIRPKEYYVGQFRENKCSGWGSLKESNTLYQGFFEDLKKHQNKSGDVFVVSLKRERCRIGAYSRNSAIDYHVVRETNSQTEGTTAINKCVLYNYSNGEAKKVVDLKSQSWFDF